MAASRNVLTSGSHHRTRTSWRSSPPCPEMTAPRERELRPLAHDLQRLILGPRLAPQQNCHIAHRVLPSTGRSTSIDSSCQHACTTRITRKIQPERQRPEPIGYLLLSVRSLDDVQERLMLLPVPRLVMIPQEFARPLQIGCHPCDSVELVITQDTAAAPASTIPRTSATVANCFGPRSIKSPTKIAVRSGCRQTPPQSR